MATKKTTNKQRYILISEATDMVLCIGTLEEMKNEMEILIDDENDVQDYKIYEVGKQLSVSAKLIGYKIDIF